MAGVAGPALVRSADGTPIAVYRSGVGPPLVLVHGTTADHTTWRAVGPLLGERHTVLAIDRRGRGASGDTFPHSIEREEEDVAAVAAFASAGVGRPVAVLGHSYGGRCALGAALLTDAIERVVVYEGPVGRDSFGDTAAMAAELERLLASGDRAAVFETFMRGVVGLTDEEWAVVRSAETYPLRVAAADTIPRELRAGVGPASDLQRFGTVRQPVLQVVGGASDLRFRAAADALADVLRRGRLVVIEGARHAAHHTHAERFVAEILAFTGT